MPDVYHRRMYELDAQCHIESRTLRESAASTSQRQAKLRTHSARAISSQRWPIQLDYTRWQPMLVHKRRRRRDCNEKFIYRSSMRKTEVRLVDGIASAQWQYHNVTRVRVCAFRGHRSNSSRRASAQCEVRASREERQRAVSRQAGRQVMT